MAKIQSQRKAYRNRKAHRQQQMELIEKMISDEARRDIEMLRTQHWREEKLGNRRVKFVCLCKRSDDEEGDMVAPAEVQKRRASAQLMHAPEPQIGQCRERFGGLKLT